MVRLRTPTEIGSAVRRERRAVGLTQVQLAKVAGVSREWVVRLERGTRGLEFGLVLDVLASLHMDLSYEIGVDKATEAEDDLYELMLRNVDGEKSAENG